MVWVLRRRCFYGKNSFILFNWSLFIITQWKCTSISSCRTKKWTNGSVAAHVPMAMQPAIAHQNGRGVWVYKQPIRRRISDFFERSNWGVQLIARPGTQYSFHISGNRGYDSNDYILFRYFTRTASKTLVWEQVQSRRAMTWNDSTPRLMWE